MRTPSITVPLDTVIITDPSAITSHTLLSASAVETADETADDMNVDVVRPNRHQPVADSTGSPSASPSHPLSPLLSDDANNGIVSMHVTVPEVNPIEPPPPPFIPTALPSPGPSHGTSQAVPSSKVKSCPSKQKSTYIDNDTIGADDDWFEITKPVSPRHRSTVTRSSNRPRVTRMQLDPQNKPPHDTHHCAHPTIWVTGIPGRKIAEFNEYDMYVVNPF